jgi:hypothetical protein
MNKCSYALLANMVNGSDPSCGLPATHAYYAPLQHSIYYRCDKHVNNHKFDERITLDEALVIEVLTE